MIWSVLLIIVLIALSALFSGSEISYASSGELRLRKAAESGKLKDKLAYEIYTSYDKALVSILIGNNLVNIGSSAVATAIAVELMGESGAWIASAVMTVIIITLGEITPKILATKRPEKFAAKVSPAIRACMWITGPVVFLQSIILKALSGLWKENMVDDAVTEDDLETIIETVEDEGVVDEDTADLLQNALDFDEVMAYEIITPRVDMVAVNIDDDERRIYNTILNSRYSRVPVYQDTTDNIIGIVHVNHVLKKMAAGEEFDLRQFMMKPHFVHKTMILPDVLSIMQKSKNHMVIVTDEYGGTMGLITMEDVLEQLVGEIWDEKDVIDEEFREIGDNLYEADGDMRIEDMFRELDMDEKDFDDDNATLGGWAIEMLGDYPHRGDSFEYRNLHITVSEMRNLRVRSLIVHVNEASPEESEN